MSEFEKKILTIISEKPGIKAKDIATIIGCEKKEVNSVLYGNLSGRCYQDSKYCWYLTSQKNGQKTANPIAPPDKKLADLCKYYLNCLGYEESNGISTYLTPDFSLNYAELSKIGVDGSEENVQKLIQKVSCERNLTAHIGYPVLIKKFYSTKNNKEYFRIAPVFLFSVEISAGSVNVGTIPHINMEVIKQYSNRDINSQVYDFIELENELGLNSMDNDIEIDEMIARLQNIREWQWVEKLDPNNICETPRVNTIDQEGIYNKAIFIVSERSPYTVGLESELSKLAQLDEASYRGTALHDWLYRDTANTAEILQDKPLLEVLPMNTEQEQAIRSAANNKLTIVTGPPGTGKSQVVTNLLMNAAWNGEKVLFTSKNNKAVDVVETRVNAYGHRPIMLRIGGEQNACHLAEIISDLLAFSADKNDQIEYQRYNSLYKNKTVEYQKLKSKKEKVINYRNRVDRLEQKISGLREKWGDRIKSISEYDADDFGNALKLYRYAYEDWNNSKNSFLGKLFWFLIGKSKTEQVECCLRTLNRFFEKYEQSIIAKDSSLLTTNIHAKICDVGEEMVYELHAIGEYKDALEALLNEPRIEELDNDLIKIKADLADVSEKLWDKWLLTRPLELDSDCREEMNEYVTAIRMIGTEDLSKFPDIKRKFNRLQQKMTAFLPCWAVTSLSAKGRIPFQPGLFDLVVIDEASQCDIASVLPMLYRAKKAIIIGDPKQLSHISTISKTQDLSLIQRYEINIGWSYSANSLYAVANSLASPDQIIQLRDHHRSFSDIIEFSNAEFYGGKLRVATNYDRLKCPLNTSPGIRWIDTVGKTIRPYDGGAYNEIEVESIIKELKRLVQENQYEGSVGVVTPFRAQAERIKKEIEKDDSLRIALLKNDFLVDTVHKFQGDERDVMFFSPVISHGTGKGAIGFLSNTGNLFNVAITRARAVLIVVGDQAYCAQCGVSYMEHFVEHVKNISRLDNPKNDIIDGVIYDRDYPKVSNSEQVSDWERQLYTALFDQGIKTIPQYPVDKYKLDLAIIDGERMLDIEVDGEMYHKDWNGELCYRDQLRNQRLFELGWDVKRFWVYQIRDDLQSCIDQIKDWCNQ